MEFHGLWAWNSRVTFNHVNHCRGFRSSNVLQWRLVPVRIKVLVEKVIPDIELTIPLNVTLSIHANPIHRTRAGAYGLEAISVCQNPI